MAWCMSSAEQRLSEVDGEASDGQPDWLVKGDGRRASVDAASGVQRETSTAVHVVYSLRTVAGGEIMWL